MCVVLLTLIECQFSHITYRNGIEIVLRIMNLFYLYLVVVERNPEKIILISDEAYIDYNEWFSFHFFSSLHHEMAIFFLRLFMFCLFRLCFILYLVVAIMN